MKLRMKRVLWEEMRADIEKHLPEEACGLLAGEGDCAEEIFLIPNALRSTTRFRMAPQEQVDALLAIERHGWRLLAIYHSHPEGPPNPSPTDISEASYLEAFTLIWSPDGHQWGCRGFQIRADGFDEIHLVVE